MAAPPPPPPAAPGEGARRGMLDALLALSVTEEVLQDLDAHLPPLPEDQEEERQLAFEFYSAQRTQLSALPRPLLERVCGAAPAAGGSMWDVLAPVRAVRPAHGGRGWDLGVVEGLRALDVYITAGGDEGDDEANNAAGMGE
jgi:hypothetical protein